ncbi:MAG: 4Fe-4S dicluster domain-containing protein [Gemmatimonadetes bacterium]|nr:4Fe-4S dicluster domain-containing protein [Gemmatimonadota bacterium]MYJ10466.1 4Fe-4S dicluster domain-containing protein [Gemmatimonadota bacterium]
MPVSTAAHSLASAVRKQEQGLLNCVHCGFCLPACPTYRRLGDEADSPRGRLYLMQAVVEGRLDPGAEAFQTHIGRCLGCRACEPVCPSGVEYGHLLELARQVGGDARRPPVLARILLRVFGTAWLARPALFAGRLVRATGLPALLTRILAGRRPPKGARLAVAMLAASAPPPRLPGPAESRPATVPQRGDTGDKPTVGVLAGCVQAGLFGRVNQATVRVLQANGYRVVSVPNQGCCGALHAHGGDLETARSLARRNLKAFEAAGVDMVAMNASGCGAAMADYGSLLADDEEVGPRATALAGKVRDISQLLAERGPVPGGTVPLKVTYDAPCHLLHAQGVANPPARVLDSIPGLEVVPLPGTAECCGGAGIYGLTNPRLGGWIGSDKVQSVLGTGAAALVTGNPGCMMQIGAGLALTGAGIPVLHLVELLDESYRRGGLYGKVDR